MELPTVVLAEPRASWPLRLARVHARMTVGARVRIPVRSDANPTHGGSTAADIVTGAGFTFAAPRAGVYVATRARSLPDTVGPRMRVLVCGLNPSLYAADAGVGFARPGNRFWPAALAAGLVTADRDSVAALVDHGVGMTDLVKRATARASELDAAEYRAGFARLERLIRWLRPPVVCFVGLEGWRTAVDRRAVAGWQHPGISDAHTYVMPSTSGLNARTPIAELVAHLRAVVRRARTAR